MQVAVTFSSRVIVTSKECVIILNSHTGSERSQHCKSRWKLFLKIFHFILNWFKILGNTVLQCLNKTKDILQIYYYLVLKTMKERGPFFNWNQIFQNVVGIMLKLIMNVYNYIFAGILASNHRIFSFYLHYERQICW